MKPEYDYSEIVTNDTNEFYTNFTKEYDYYLKDLYVNKKGQINQLDEEDALFDILDRAFDFGYNLDNYDILLDSIPRRYIHKYLTKINAEYFRGVDKRYRDKSNLDVLRVSIYIEGTPECGKTYGSVHTLLDMNRSVYQVSASSNTGAEDNIRPYECLIYDDRIPQKVLDKADTNICELYRRNANNGVFGGDFFIMNYNTSFDKTFKNYYKDKDDTSEGLSDQAKALKTRLFIVQIIDGQVNVVQRCMRGTPEQVQQRNDKFNEFIKRFRRYIADKFEMDKHKPIISDGFDFEVEPKESISDKIEHLTKEEHKRMDPFSKVSKHERIGEPSTMTKANIDWSKQNVHLDDNNDDF